MRTATACLAALLGIAAVLSSCRSGAPTQSPAEIALMKSVRRADAEALKSAISQGASPDTQDLSGRSALTLAAIADKPEIIKALISAGANPNLADKRGNCPLHSAAATGSKASIEALVSAKAAVDEKNSYGWTPLSEAARIGNLEALEALLAAGAAIDMQDESGKTPLMHAAAAPRNSAPIARVLISKGASCKELDREGSFPLLFAIKAGNKDAATEILKAMPDFAKGKENPEALAAMKCAIMAGNLEITRMLLDKGAPFDREQLAVTKTADATETDGVYKAFARYGLIDDRRTPLMWAAISGHADIASLLIERGANPAAKDSKGNSALDYSSNIATSKVIKNAGGW